MDTTRSIVSFLHEFSEPPKPEPPTPSSLYTTTMSNSGDQADKSGNHGGSCSSTQQIARSTSLIALVVQQVALVLMIRYSRTREGATVYLASTAVVAAEVLKLVINLSLEIATIKYNNIMATSNNNNCNDNGKEEKQEASLLSPQKLWNEIFSRDSWRLVVPAFLYVVQNNLLFVALGNLSVPVYQVTNQGKLLTTAICSRWLLQKNISWMQYVSLVLLAAGVAVVQLSSMSSSSKASATTASDETASQNQLLGLFAVIASCFTSGFAGVYFEKVLKGQKKTPASGAPAATKESSVYVRNCQLAVFSIALALLPVLTTEYAVIAEHGFFAGYDVIVWLVIFCQAMTGLIVALVMKYADTILKGFCTSVAVVLATLLSIVLFGSKVDEWFAVGSAMVVGAVQMYSKYPPPTPNLSLTTLPTTQSSQEHGAAAGDGKWRYSRLLFAAALVLCLASAAHLRSSSGNFNTEMIPKPENAVSATGSVRSN